MRILVSCSVYSNGQAQLSSPDQVCLGLQQKLYTPTLIVSASIVCGGRWSEGFRSNEDDYRDHDDVRLRRR